MDNTYQEELNSAKKAFAAERYAEAAPHLERCVEKGSTEAEAALGVMLMLGLGVSRDLRRAERLLERAANKGSGLAAHNLGTFYVTCEPELPNNPELSRKWFQTAARLGFVPGTTRL